MDKKSLRYDAHDHFRLIMADNQKDMIEAELGITRDQAVTDILENTNWGEGLPQFHNGAGTPQQRLEALRRAHHEQFEPVFTYPDDPHPALNSRNTDWDAFDDQVIRICAKLRPAVEAAIAGVKADFDPPPSIIAQAIFIQALNACLDAAPDERFAYDMFKKIADCTPDLRDIPSRLSGFPRNQPEG
jgi:hypothetical protein